MPSFGIMDALNKSNFGHLLAVAPITVALAIALTSAVIALGYVMLGPLPAGLFTLGFLGGLLTWLLVPTRISFADIKLPFFVTLALFVLHKMEERYLDFFPELSKITGAPVPDTNNVLVYLLYALASAWLLVPWLVAKRHPFGLYLTWTFFVSMGVIELAHFVFPLLRPGPYSYFPGMLSTIFLAPAAWWGLHRLMKHRVRRAS